MQFVISITLIHLLACLSPGPDIFLVIRTSLRHGWRMATAMTSGILTGVCLMIALGLTGLTYLLSQNEFMVQIVTLAGGTWLIYLGSAIFKLNKGGKPSTNRECDASDAGLSLKAAWIQGLVTNVSNPKAMLYFLSIFSVMLGPDIPLALKVLCGASMVLAQAIAFTLVAMLIAHPVFKKRWPSVQQWLDWTVSFILFALGLWIWTRFALSLIA